MNKQNILRFSLSAFCLSTLLGLYVTFSVHGEDESAKNSARTTVAAGIVGLLGISSFFVGLAYPKE